jgi:pimeloyl-ACP methyl ester carboxylesterase
MSRPQLLLVPEFTEVAWTIRPRLEAWANVAAYDPPGVGDEPLPPDPELGLTHELIAQRGLDELDSHGWERVVVAADGWGIATAARIAHARPQAMAGMALGHARLTYRRHGDRPTTSAGVWEAMTQLLRQDHDAFIRHGIAQATGGSISEAVAERMLKRFPRELLVDGWERITDEDDRFGELLQEVDCPLLLAKHEGCLMSTEEGFADAVAAFPQARTISVPEAPEASPEFAEALRDFCQEVWAADEADSAFSQRDQDRQ